MLSKNILKFQELSLLPYFNVLDAAEVLGIKIASARVFCSRYVKRGLLIKLKNNYYVSSQKWNNISFEELLTVANILQVPSYISFITALSYYEITTQVQRNFVESASLKRTVEYNQKETVFKYHKLNRKYYFDFERKKNLFIATKEKSFIDSVYLYSFGKYKIDFDSIDMNKLDKRRILKLLKTYPVKTKKIIEVLCKI